MAFHMNIFRILGDVFHTLSKVILIWAIHSNRSAEGVSLITQMLYVLVFITRYLDLFWVPPHVSMWNFVLKIFYITSSLYIILLMMKVYARTREREKAWKLGAYCLGGSIVLAPIIAAIALRKKMTLISVPSTFSLILESVCVIPQLLLLRQTTVPTVIDSGYILTLGSYRAFYILNWIVRLASKEHHFEWRAVMFGIIQTAFYVDFAWVYWTRQRVKLRNGGIVDSDDLSRGFLVGRILGQGRTSMDEEVGAAPNGTGGAGAGLNASPVSKKVGKWGARGISVSADEGVMDPPRDQKNTGRFDKTQAQQSERAPMIHDDDESEDGLSGLEDQIDRNGEVEDSAQNWRDANSRT